MMRYPDTPTGFTWLHLLTGIEQAADTCFFQMDFCSRTDYAVPKGTHMLGLWSVLGICGYLQNRDVKNEQNDQRRAITLLGNFKSFETASVQWLNPDRLGQTGTHPSMHTNLQSDSMVVNGLE